MIFVVAGVILNADNKILLARKAPGKSLEGKWEFPGGKVEPDESPQEALKRELREEFGMEVEVLEYVGANEHTYEDGPSIALSAWFCKFLSGTFELTDHDAFEWVAEADLVDYDLAEADIPLVPMI